MKEDRIVYKGKEGDGPGLTAVLGRNFVYQKIHTLAHEPLHAADHLEIIELTYSNLYGSATGLSRKTLCEEISHLLKTNRYPAGSNLVTLYLFAPKEPGGHAERLLVCEKQLLYKGYTLWHKSLKAKTVVYEYPFASYKTAVSLTAHNYATEHVQRKGCEQVLTVNYKGHVTSAGEDPVFAVSGNSVYTPPLDETVAESVERRLTIEACARAGMPVYEKEIEAGSLNEYDELFTTKPQGIYSIGQAGRHIYPNSAAQQVASSMAELAFTGPV